jgi:hypothetical protein
MFRLASLIRRSDSNNTGVRRSSALALACSAFLGLSLTCDSHAADAPWWDQFPGIIQIQDSTRAIEPGATASLCGASDDPCWGLYAQRMTQYQFGAQVAPLHKAGLKVLTWFEGFGTCEAYVAQLRRDTNCSWIRCTGDASLTRIFHTHWDWQNLEGNGEIRWVGLPNYFDDNDFARPWTRTHPRLGCPPMRYPDGRVATGYRDNSTDPRDSLVFDAGCSKDILGRVTFEYDYSTPVNLIQTNTRLPQGPLTGLLQITNPPSGPPDPGFTPEEWKSLKHAAYAGVITAGKDTACPVWIDYLKASIQMALDKDMDGLWVDNWSPWDSFSLAAITKGFGEWSVAGFRDYVKDHFTPEERSRLGITNTATFDVREYLLARANAWGGNPRNFEDRVWLDPRWSQDRVWRAYLIYKRQTGSAALSRYYKTVKETAKAAGKPDFLVMGNDIPLYSLGWARGDLDMVSTELSWGWHLTSGPRGLMPPPKGSYVPVYKLAREHARSRFVNAWMYSSPEQLGRTNMARTLYCQALANHALPMPFPNGRTVGNTNTDREFFALLRRVAPIFGNRQPVETIGLYYSSSSQLMEMLPGGFRDHARQPHSFAFWGWGTALSQLHLSWIAVPEWKLAERLPSLRLIIVPESQVFDRDDAARLESWVRAGGCLLLTGESGIRLGESDQFDPAPVNTLQFARQAPADHPQTLGKGQTLWLKDDPGIEYYLQENRRPALLPGLAQPLQSLNTFHSCDLLRSPKVPATVGLTLYQNAQALFLDINNTDIHPEDDTITPTPSMELTLALPEPWKNRPLTLRTVSFLDTPQPQILSQSPDEIRLRVDPVTLYTSIILEPK